jgi:hypothetical protein
MLISIEQTRMLLTQLREYSDEQIEAVFGARTQELVEIAIETVTNLEATVRSLPQHATEKLTDDGMRLLRHDLRGLVGTMHSSMAILVRRRASGPLADLARQLGNTTEDLRDIVDALMEERERTV